MHILYADAVSLFYDPGYGNRLGKYFILPRTVPTSDYKESFIATSKTDKEKPGARCWDRSWLLLYRIDQLWLKES